MIIWTDLKLTENKVSGLRLCTLSWLRTARCLLMHCVEFGCLIRHLLMSGYLPLAHSFILCLCFIQFFFPHTHSFFQLGDPFHLFLFTPHILAFRVHPFSWNSLFLLIIFSHFPAVPLSQIILKCLEGYFKELPIDFFLPPTEGVKIIDDVCLDLFRHFVTLTWVRGCWESAANLEFYLSLTWLHLPLGAILATWVLYSVTVNTPPT